MNRILGTMVALLTAALTAAVVAGCGSQTGSQAGPSKPASRSDATLTPVVARVVPGPNAVRGRRDTVATALPDRTAVKAYAARLAGPLQIRVRTAATALLRRDGTLYAQTVFDGCGTPPVGSLMVSRTSAGSVVIRTDYSDPATLDCLVGVRSVALVVLP